MEKEEKIEVKEVENEEGFGEFEIEWNDVLLSILSLRRYNKKNKWDFKIQHICWIF